MSSNPMDRVIGLLYREGGDALLIETGREVRLRSGQSERVVLAQKLRIEQIEHLLLPTMPSSMAPRIKQDGELSYPHQSAHGAVLVRTMRKGDRMRVHLVPAPGPEASDAASGGVALESPLDSVMGAGGGEPVPDEPGLVAVSSPAASAPRPSAPATAADHVPKKIDGVLRALVEGKGSDLHLTADLRPLYRMDGDICPLPGYDEPLSSDTIEEWLLEIAAEQSRIQFQETHDADYAYEIPGVARYRVNLFRDRRGVGAVFRVIPSEVLTADQLNLPPVIREMCTLDKGLVVVTGPTGSGKSTTLAAMIDLINKTRTDHIITIEDPVEFVHQPQKCLINQREVHTHTKSFSAALRAALREDPDIVLVGELRDLETVSIAIETAETGHLVFGTLHTNTAMSTVDRVIDQFPTDQQEQIRIMLSESLRGVVAQTLCKKKGGGRIAALEILKVIPSVANLIREAKTFQLPSVMQTGKGQGMQMLNDALLTLVKEDKIEPSEAQRRSIDKADMEVRLKRLNPGV